MKLLETIRSWFGAGDEPDSNGRVKCVGCRNRILPTTAADNNGLCGVCFKKVNPKPKPDPNKPSAYHLKLDTPVDQLTDKDKKLQLTGALTWKNEKRIDEVLAGAPELVSKSPSYSNHTWLGHAVAKDCDIPILAKLLAAGCDVNSCSEKTGSGHLRPLEIAISNDRIEIVNWLLANRADPNLGRPIIGAINHRKAPDLQLQMLKLLLAAGGEINRTFELYGDEKQRFTVLDWAEMYNLSPDVIDFLKSKGAKKSWTNEMTRENQNKLGDRKIVP